MIHIKKSKSCIILILTFIFLVSGCSKTNIKTSSNSLNNKDAIWREVGGWPKPPLYQGNNFAAGGVGAAYSFVFEPLFQYVRSTDKIYPRLAVSMTNKNNMTIVKLRKDVLWNDGKPFTSKDVWAYYILNNGTQINKYLDKIETPDKYTVDFVWKNPLPYEKIRELFIALDYQQIPYHVYQKYVDKANELLSQCKKLTDQNNLSPFGLDITQTINNEISLNWQGFIKDNPKYPIGTGPYAVNNVTTSDMVLTKRPNYYNKNNIHFNKILFKQTDASGSLAMLKNGQVERFDGTPPKDEMDNILNSNKNLIHYIMLGTGSTGTIFNLRKAPFNNVQFRRAIEFAIDKDKIRQVSNFYAINYDISVSAIPPSTIPQEVSQNVQDKMTKFTYDPTKATGLLKEINWEKGTDGIWKDPDGKSYNFVIGATNTSPWFTNGSEVAAEQLTKFGLPTKLQVTDSSIYFTNAQKGKYDMSTDFIDITYSFLQPYFSLYNFYFGAAGKYTGFNYINSGKNAGDLNLKLPDYNGKSVDINKSVNELPYIQNDDQRKDIVSQLVWITNENAFGIDFFQNVTGTWFNLKTVSGMPWLDVKDKYKRNIPLATTDDLKEKIAETNLGFAGIQIIINGSYSPK